MSKVARIAVLLATVAVLALAFVLLSPEADDDSNTAETPTTATPATTTAPTNGTTTPPGADHQRARPPAPAFERVSVRGGKPVGEIQKITVRKGERARFEVSADTSDEVHLHGYDITRDVKPGSPARFSFKADAEGIFEIELHSSHTQIAELAVEP